MTHRMTIDKPNAVGIVEQALGNISATILTQQPELDEETVLFGSDGLLDSMGLVSVLVEVEQMVAEQYELEITLGDDRAVSMTRSPFRTVGSLADYVIILAAEARGADVRA